MHITVSSEESDGQVTQQRTSVGKKRKRKEQNSAGSKEQKGKKSSGGKKRKRKQQNGKDTKEQIGEKSSVGKKRRKQQQKVCST